MWFSVGQLYSAQKLLAWVDRGGVRPEDISASEIASILLCPAAEVLEIVVKGAWATVNVDGHLELSVRGKVILGVTDPVECLREQLQDLITIDQPVWTKLIPRGRRELTKTAPTEICQILQEAGLLDAQPSDNVLRWWDDMAAFARGVRASRLLEIGRHGEKFTIQYERRRTSKEPTWQSIESNVSGFDVLSVVNVGDTTRLRIEVKASSHNINAAEFYVTRNEWDTALATGNYVFHLWQIKNRPRLAVISIDKLISHLPSDVGTGVWQSARVPFSAFKSEFTEILV